MVRGMMRWWEEIGEKEQAWVGDARYRNAAHGVSCWRVELCNEWTFPVVLCNVLAGWDWWGVDTPDYSVSTLLALSVLVYQPHFISALLGSLSTNKLKLNVSPTCDLLVPLISGDSVDHPWSTLSLQDIWGSCMSAYLCRTLCNDVLCRISMRWWSTNPIMIFRMV